MEVERLRSLARQIVSGWQGATCARIRGDLKYALTYARQFNATDQDKPFLSEVVEHLINCENEACLTDALTVAFSDELSSTRNSGESGEQELAQRIRSYLDTVFCEEFNRERLSKLFGYNKNYLTSVFSQNFGMAPGQYVIKKRVQFAKTLLLSDPVMKVKIVARRVGYEDSLYFSRVFKAQTGVSPSEYFHQKSDVSQPKTP